MLGPTQSFVPSEWQSTIDLLSAPLAWIPAWHTQMVNFVWYGDTFSEMLFKRVLILLPMLLLLAAVWSTMVSLYTIPFRSKRGGFLTAILLGWWDVGRTIWLYWAGLVRFVLVLVGWTWATIRLVFQMLVTGLKGTFRSPLAVLDWTSRNYFKPGVPWVAFLALMVWTAVEATIFMYTLSPTLSEVLSGITGYEPNPRLVGPLLWIFLYFLILGSFACIQVLTQAIASRNVGEIIQMIFVELSVMFFEVIFLYRELVDAITPWIAQQTNENVRLGLVSTLALACFGWVGVRGMTWFLFGRYGTPAVLAILARDTIREGAPVATTPMAPQPDIWRGPIQALKDEVEYFKAEAKRGFELITLPVLQVLACAVNMIVIVIRSQPLFRLPFASIDDALAVAPRWGKKGESDAAPGLEPTGGFTHGGTR
jgi:hypothetical protein